MSKNKAIFLLLAIIIIHAFVLTKLIFFPYPELFIYPYLTNNGLKPYSQILDQHFPGLMFLPVNFDNLGMTNEVIARVWLIGIVVITHLLLFLISRHILKSSVKALLVNLLYFVWQPFFEGWVLWIDSFLPLLLLPACYFLYRKKYFLTGLLLGLSVVFKQVLIPLALIVIIFLIFEKSVKKIGKYLGGLILPIGGMLTYFLIIGVFGDFFYWTVIFNLITFAQSGRGVSPNFAYLSRAAFVLGFSLLALPKIKEREGQILFIFLIGALFGLSTRFDFVHLQPALPFAILAFVFGLRWLGRIGRLTVIIFYGLITLWWLSIFYKGHLGDRIISFDADTYKIAEKIRSYTTLKEKIFIFGAAPHLYQMTETLPAGNLFIFQFPWFFQIAQERILEGIKKDNPNIVVMDRTVEVDKQPIAEFGSTINQYLTDNYEKIDSVGNTEILKKK